MIIAGEASGDLHASGLLREFKRLQSGAHFFGTGGDRMAAAGLETLYHIKDISFLGFVEVLRHLPFIRRMMAKLLQETRRRRPRAVVLVDYPGFNLRFAARLRKIPELQGIPILYYISPQVWAWRSSRVPQIARLVDRMAVIFDFELPIYEAAGLRADFVGHPLLETARAEMSAADFRRQWEIPENAPLIALLPGSRKQEVLSLFPLFLQTLKILRENSPQLHALVGCSPALHKSLYAQILSDTGHSGPEIRLTSNQTYDLLTHSRVALVASGTVTLEAALMGTPMVMAYRVAPLTYFMGRILVKIPNIALVNVVAGKRIVPEFIQHEATPERLADELSRLLADESYRAGMIEQLSQVRQKLGTPGASARVAKLLNDLILEGSSRA